MFADRTDAGRQLAAQLAPLGLRRALVLGVPRGGVPVAAEVADALGAPLDVFVAVKVGAPGQPELGVGAVAEGLEDGMLLAPPDVLGIRARRLEHVLARSRAELHRRVRRYRGGRRFASMRGRDVVLVDDGLATGVTAHAALLGLKGERPNRLVLAIPVCAPDAAGRLDGVADDIVFVASPTPFNAVGQWYRDFSQTSDDEVIRLVHQRRDRIAS